MVADMVSAFTLDGLANSHPIKVPVNHPDEINEIFDSISYNKVRFCFSPSVIVAVGDVSVYIYGSHSVFSVCTILKFAYVIYLSAEDNLPSKLPRYKSCSISSTLRTQLLFNYHVYS